MSEPPPIRLRPPRLAELATWTTAWRERWGHRANQLQDEGVPWPDHEVQAFDEINAAKTRSEKPEEPATSRTTASKAASKGETTGRLNLGIK